MSDILVTIFIYLAEELVDDAIDYAIRWAVDEFGNKTVEFFYEDDIDGDGVIDDVVITSIQSLIPNLDSQYNFVSDGDTVGIGFPALQIIDGIDIANYVDTLYPGDYPIISGNSGGYLYDIDNDGHFDDVIVPLDDLTGDNVPDYGLVLDEDDNGVPDVADDTPYYPVGSDGFNNIMRSFGSSEPSIIVMSSDGTMTVYDTSGQITAEDCDTAYSLWMSENGIMNKPLDNYTVTEGILFISFLVGCFGFIGMLFRRKKVM